MKRLTKIELTYDDDSQAMMAAQDETHWATGHDFEGQPLDVRPDTCWLLALHDGYYTKSDESRLGRAVITPDGTPIGYLDGFAHWFDTREDALLYRSRLSAGLAAILEPVPVVLLNVEMA